MKNKIVYIDGWFLQPPLRGVGNYIKNLLTNLEIEDNSLKYILLVPRNDLDLSYLPEYISIKIINCKYILVWYEFCIPRLLNSMRDPYIFYPSGICSLIYQSNKKNIFSTIHDVSAFMSFKYSPINFNLRSIFGRLYRIFSFYKMISNSKILFTVSETAKYGIEKLLPKRKNNIPEIKVVYNGSQVGSLKIYSKSKNFLCITGESNQKNSKCVINALDYFDDLSLEGWKIYFVGLKRNKIFKHPSGVKIIYLKYLDFNEILELYDKAYGLLFPSLFESFGIPLVDAMKARCHIIASDQGSPHEICGDNGIYFDPNSSYQLFEKICEIVSRYPSPPFINSKNKALNQTWFKSSKTIFDIIEDKIIN
tara:strand:+ start:447 stop:1541 length:1095 start_codon:yes stop_codon:yes gene_type:complete